MAQAIVDQGKTAVRDALKTLVTHVGVSTNATAFNGAQTELNPGATGTNLIKVSTEANVDGATFDATMSITGTSEFTGLSIMTIGILDGAAATDVIARVVRGAGLGIGVQAGDVFTVGCRVAAQDNS